MKQKFQFELLWIILENFNKDSLSCDLVNLGNVPTAVTAAETT